MGTLSSSILGISLVAGWNSEPQHFPVVPPLALSSPHYLRPSGWYINKRINGREKVTQLASTELSLTRADTAERR